MIRQGPFFRYSSLQRLLALLLAALLVGCQSSRLQPPQTTDQDGVESTAEIEDHINLPDVDLSAELLSQILTAEIAVRNGQFEQAVDQLMLAAQESKDPRLAARAARWALQSGLYEKSKTAALAWIELLDESSTTEWAKAHFTLASGYLELGQVDSAVESYHRLINRGLDDNIYQLIAYEVSGLTNRADAIPLYQRLLEESEDKENANLGLSILAARLSQFDLSQQAVHRVLQINPDNVDAALIKFSFLVEDKNDEAVASFAEQFLKRNPNSDRVRLEYARYLAGHDNRENHKRAIEQYKQITKKDPELHEQAMLSTVALAMQEEQYDLADKNLERLIEADPTNSRLVYFQCQVKRELKKYRQAKALCEEIVDGENYFPAQIEIAIILADQDRLADALAYLDEVPVSGEDEQIRIYMAQQSILHDADQLEEAVNLLTRALGVYSDHISLLYARGLVLSELGKVSEHERDMRKVIELDPENAHAYNALGYTLSDLTSRYDEALELIQKAVELSPDDAYILDSLGWVYFKMNDLDKARVNLEKAFMLSDDAEIAAHLGELYWVSGEQSRARSLWLKAREKTPDNKVLNKTLERFL